MVNNSQVLAQKDCEQYEVLDQKMVNNSQVLAQKTVNSIRY
jgi:hypothetical protein